MSRNGLELALWELSVDREAKRRYAADPDSWLARRRLDDEERRAIRDVAPSRLLALGANPMLAMGFWFEQHAPDMDAYRTALGDGGEN